MSGACDRIARWSGIACRSGWPGAEGLKRLGKCFRDEEELAAAAELGPKIEAALKLSDVLVLVCSPRSPKSRWANREIAAFKRLGREHRVFALIVHGVPRSADHECFPEALKWAAACGVAEPLAVNLRRFGREDAALRWSRGYSILATTACASAKCAAGAPKCCVRRRCSSRAWCWSQQGLRAGFRGEQLC